MTGPELFPEEIRKKIQELGDSDIVVGIPSLNNAKTISSVVQTVKECLRTDFPDARSVIVNADGGSQDDTVRRVAGEIGEDRLVTLSYPLYPVQDLANPYSGIPGKANALREIFQAAGLLGARACVIVDPDFANIRKEWLRLLLEPVYTESFDFVAPCYRRKRFEGTLASGIVYPMTRALYGSCVRHPIGGDYCFSSAMISHFMKQDIWDRESARFGVDIWLATEAASRRFKAVQVHIGEKCHDIRTPAPDLSRTVTRVMGAVFDEMERNTKIWQRVRGSETIPVLGVPEQPEKENTDLDVSGMIDSYALGVTNLFGFWGTLMTPFTLMELKKLNRRVNGDFRFPDSLWVRVVYDFAVAYHSRTISREHLLEAMTPLYLGWVASFMLQMQDADPSVVEARIQDLCSYYEREKPYLISRWRWPDRFSP
jgi:glucosylglycerate synthase